MPIYAAGALFSVGDAHAAQGQGEVDLTAIETGLRGRFQFIVRKDMKMTWPRADVDEDVFPATLRLDEPVSLLRIEPLHRAARHRWSPESIRLHSLPVARIQPRCHRDVWRDDAIETGRFRLSSPRGRDRAAIKPRYARAPG
jgi:Acetamidase/Formamidase family